MASTPTSSATPAASTAPDAATPKRRSVGDFDIDRKVGSGSFAKVYRATHQRTKRIVAIKAVDKRKLNVKHQQNLESEIKIMRRFQHRNLVRLLGTYSGPRHMYLVMEYCGGGDLASAIRRYGPLPEQPTVCRLMGQLAAGLQFLWTRNLIHRDIKPQNILMTGGLDSTLKIADFGFARYLGAASLAQTACGSPLYMAPEVLRRETYNGKADLWSVGCVMFEMLAKETPFTGFDQTELLRNVERGRRAALPAGTRVTPACTALMAGLLRQNQLQRLSFEEFFKSAFVQQGLQMLEKEGVLDPSTAAAVAGVGETGGGGGWRTRRVSEPSATVTGRGRSGTPGGTTPPIPILSASQAGPSGAGGRSQRRGGSGGGGRQRAHTADVVHRSQSEDFVFVDTTTSKNQVLFNDVSGASSVPPPQALAGLSTSASGSGAGSLLLSQMPNPPLPQQHYQQQSQQQQLRQQQLNLQQQRQELVAQQQLLLQQQLHLQQQQQQQQQQRRRPLLPSGAHPPSGNVGGGLPDGVAVLPPSMPASAALPLAHQSDQLWRRGLAVGQLAEALLSVAHGQSSARCTLFQDAACPPGKGLWGTSSSVMTALAVAMRSLLLLRTAYERRNTARGGGVSSSATSVTSKASGSSSESGSSGGHGGVFQADGITGLSSDEVAVDGSSSSSGDAAGAGGSGGSGGSGAGGGDSTDEYNEAMRKQIRHYCQVTNTARAQLVELAQLGGFDAAATSVRDWDGRCEAAVLDAVLDMSRRAAGLQALTSTCTSTALARAQSGAHAKTLYEHTLCLLEELLAGSQERPARFQRLAALADGITGRMHGLMASSTRG